MVLSEVSPLPAHANWSCILLGRRYAGQDQSWPLSREGEREWSFSLCRRTSNALTYRAYRAQLRSLSIDLVLSSVRMGRGGEESGNTYTRLPIYPVKYSFCHGNLKTIELPLGDESPWIPEFYSHVKRGLAPLFTYVFHIYAIYIYVRVL